MLVIGKRLTHKEPGEAQMTGWKIAIGLAALLPALAFAVQHSYVVRVADDLKSVDVTARLGRDVDVLRARDGGTRRLSSLASCEGQPLRTRRNRVITTGVDCVSYRYPLRPPTGRRAPPTPDDVMVSAPGQWLWLPSLDQGHSVRIELVLPPGAVASVPWRRVEPGVHVLDASPRSSTAVAVFGAFTRRDLPLAGGSLRVALVDAPQLNLDEGKILRWLESAADDVVGVSGRLPNPGPQVIVQPLEGGRSPVPFGYVIRDGGEAVRFYVDPRRPLADYLGDWTATHEFSHLLLPYVRSEQKWISEGFASYYQNVLLARRGAYTESEAWRRLQRSFARAGQVRNPPTLNGVTERPFWEMRMLIYWSGAAIALMADTRLRDLSDGRESLDTVLGRLQDCCLPATQAWDGERLFRKLDSLSPHPVFMDLYRSHADARGMPDLEPYYRDLGLEFSAEGVVFDDRARLAGVRRAIMAKAILCADLAGGDCDGDVRRR